MRDAWFYVVRDHLDILNVLFLSFLLFSVKGNRLGWLLSGLFDAFRLILLEAESTWLPIDLRVEWLIFEVKVMLLINDVGEFFTEESVERLHGSIDE